MSKIFSLWNVDQNGSCRCRFMNSLRSATWRILLTSSLATFAVRILRNVRPEPDTARGMGQAIEHGIGNASRTVSRTLLAECYRRPGWLPSEPMAGFVGIRTIPTG
jgi:hypothetical protein